MWVTSQGLPRSAAHPFHTRLNQILEEDYFDRYVEGASDSTRTMVGRDGRPGAISGCCWLAISKGLDAERAIAWRAADTFALREFSGWCCRTRRRIIRRLLARVALIDLETWPPVIDVAPTDPRVL